MSGWGTFTGLQRRAAARAIEVALLLAFLVGVTVGGLVVAWVGL